VWSISMGGKFDKFPNPPESLKEHEERWIGGGQESVVFSHTENEEEVVAYERNQDIYEKHPALYIRHKQILYCHKILRLLYPKNFPAWKRVGTNKTGYIASVRERVSGAKDIGKNPKQLVKVSQDFKEQGLLLGLDLAKVNVFYDNKDKDTEKYIDRVGLVFINTVEDLQRLGAVMDKLNVKDDVRDEALSWAKKILLLHRVESRFMRARYKKPRLKSEDMITFDAQGKSECHDQQSLFS
jgi:hypothetical protein